MSLVPLADIFNHKAAIVQLSDEYAIEPICFEGGDESSGCSDESGGNSGASGSEDETAGHCGDAYFEEPGCHHGGSASKNCPIPVECCSDERHPSIVQCPLVLQQGTSLRGLSFHVSPQADAEHFDRFNPLLHQSTTAGLQAAGEAFFRSSTARPLRSTSLR